MVIRIRLARFGKRNKPFYNIVVAQARTARNSKPMEVIGTFDPLPQTPPDGEGRAFKDVKLDLSRAKYWLGVGAQPSDPAWRLLSMVGLLEPKFAPTKAKEQAEIADESLRRLRQAHANNPKTTSTAEAVGATTTPAPA